MKNLLTLAALLGAASLSFSQGIVNFGNASVSMRVSTNAVGVIAGGTAGITATTTSGNVYYYALLEAPTTQTTIDNSFTGWTFTGNYETNSLTGRFNGNYTADPGVIVQGAVGSSANFAFVGWSANLSTGANAPVTGNSQAFNAALAKWNNGNTAGTDVAFFFGYSGVAANQILGGGSTPVPSPAGSVSGFALNYYVPVPEPTSFALLGLGAGALAIFRRRK